MRGLKKGMTNNPAGRPAGRPNKITKQLRERISDFLNEKRPQIEKDFQKLEPKERVLLYERLIQYIVPRLQATEITTPEPKQDSDLLKEARKRLFDLTNDNKGE